MGKTISKRLLCLLLAFTLVFALISVPAFAEDGEEVAEEATDADTVESNDETADEDAEESEESEDDAEQTAVEAVQALIDALPSADGADSATEEELDDIYVQVSAIWDAYDALSEDEQAEVDTTELEAWSEHFSGGIATAEEEEEEENTTSTAVASIDEKPYATLAAAFSEATDGATVTLINDVTLNGSLVYENTNSVTLDLSGKTITFAYNEGKFNDTALTDGAWGLKVAAGTLTIKDSSEDESGGIVTADVNTYVDVVGASGSAVLNIESGNFTTNSIYEAVVFATGNAEINISGGTFTNEATSYAYNSTYTEGLVLNLGNSSTATITVTGGTFVGRNPALGDDYLTTDAASTFVKSGYVYDVTTGEVYEGEYVAEIDGVGYVTLAAAVAAATQGDTVELLKNTSGCGIITGSTEDNHDFEIDFNGYTYTVNSDPLAGSGSSKTQCFQLLKATGSLTMKDGTILADHSGIKMMIQNYCNLTLDSMTLNATAEGTTNKVSYVLSNNCGNVTITGSTTITAKDGGVAFDVFYWPSGGYDSVSVTIDSDDVTINGTIEYGANTGTEVDPENTVLEIKAGTINGEISTFNLNSDGETGITISGGTFDTDVSEYCADGYAAVYSSDGTVKYTVESGNVAVCDADGNCIAVYDTMYAASSAAVSGQTLKLVGDIGSSDDEADDYFRADSGKTLTLDLNGYNIYATSGSNTGSKATAVLVTGSTELEIVNNSGKGGVVTTSGTRAVWMIKGSLTINAEGYKWTAADNAVYVSSQDDTYTAGDKEETLLTIECGTFYGKSAVALKNDRGDVKINGGIFVGYSGDSTKAIAIAGGSGDGLVTITDGYFAGSFSTQGSDFAISGGYYLSGISANDDIEFATGMSCIALDEVVTDSEGNTYSCKVDYYTFSYGYINTDGDSVVKGSASSIYNLYSALNVMTVDEGDTISTVFIQMNKDYETTGTFDVSSITNTDCKNITFDLNGYTLSTTGMTTPAFTVQSGYTVTIEDSSGDDSGKMKAASDSPYGTVKNRGGNLTITGGTFENTSYSLLVNNNGGSSGAVTTITGGRFINSNTNSAAFYQLAGTTLSIEGGYFAVDPSSSGFVADGYTVYSSGDEGYPYVVLSGVAASIGTVYYGTLEEAVAAAVSGDTVTLLADVKVDTQIVVSTTVTLDLAGYEVTRGSCENSALIRVTNGGTLTIEDSGEGGTIDASVNFTTSAGSTYAGIGLQVSGSSAAAVIAGGTISGYYGLYVTSGASVQMTGGTATGYIAAYANSATFEATGGKIESVDIENSGWVYGVYMTGSANVTLSGNVVVDADCKSDGAYGAGVVLWGSGSESGANPTLNISGGTITGKNYGISGNGSSDYTTIYITGGTISGNGAGIYHPQSGTLEITGEDGAVSISGGVGIQMCDGELTVGQPSTEEDYETNNARISITGTAEDTHTDKSGDGLVPDGAAISIVNRLASAGYGTPTVTIYGGSFTSELAGNAVTTYTWSNNTLSEWDDVDTYVNISGGTYSSQLELECCADDYQPTVAQTDDDGNTYYTVKDRTAVAMIAHDDEDDVYYDSLAAAVEAAESDETVETITIIGEATVDAALTVSKSLTIDLADGSVVIGTVGTTISNVTLTIAEGAEVTIIASGDGYVANYGTIAANGTLDISELGYTTDTTAGGLLAQTCGKISIGASGVFVASDVWDELWSWTPNLPSATSGSGIFSSAAEGAKVYCADNEWICTTAFEAESYDSNVTYWSSGVTLGVSSDGTATVSAEIVSGEGTSVMYAKVSAADMSKYSTEAYPTTSLTFTDEDGNTHGYIFAGWYEDSTGTTACTSIPTEAAYAKFVDEDVLKVICYFTPSTVSTSGKGNVWRVVTSWDKIYTSAGIEVYTDSGCTNIVENAITKLSYYPSYSVGKTGNISYFYPTTFSSASNYVITGVFYDSTVSVTSYTVKAGWQTTDGTIVYGNAYTFDCTGKTTAGTIEGVKAD